MLPFALLKGDAISSTRPRGCLVVLVGVTAVILIVLIVLVQAIRSRVNIRPLIGSGDEATLNLPSGFEANVYASGLAGPRFIAFGPDDLLYVAERGNDRIVALLDADGDGTAESVRIFAQDLNQPHSLLYHQDAWYVGLPDGIMRLADADGDGRLDQAPAKVISLPDSGAHRTRTIEFLADGRLVVSVGSTCNACFEEDERRATVLVYDGPGGTGESIYARGLRNAVGLAVHPRTGELWATNNGRDLLGDDLPPDTIHIVKDGADYGWPRCHGGAVVDPEVGWPGACEGIAPTLVELQAHSAPLGLVFYTGELFPAEYQGDLFVAFHGSWNRSEPTGYKVVRIPLDGSEPAGPVEDFATGWLNETTGQASGRPVGLAVGPDGSLYVSEDKAGIIYRISYVGPQ
jgi:glucose/arabinose dehydrogenase